MLGHLLVLLDGTPITEYILPQIKAIAEALGTRVTLLRDLRQPHDQNRSRMVDPLEWQILTMEIEANLGRIVDNLQVWGMPVEKVVLESTGNILGVVAYAREHAVDLIVIPNLREYLSDMLVNVLTYSRVPILIMPVTSPARKETIAFRRLLVPLDGSQRAECALPIANALASICDAQIILAHVVRKPELIRRAPLSTEERGLMVQITECNKNDASRYLEQLTNQFRGEAQYRLLVHDDIPTALHSLVEQEHVDLIVLSAHGYSGQPRWPFGGVAGNLIAYSTKPILVIQDLPATAVVVDHEYIPQREMRVSQ